MQKSLRNMRIVSKAVGGKKTNVVANLFCLSVGKERKGFLNYGLYSVLACRGTRERFNAS